MTSNIDRIVAHGLGASFEDLPDRAVTAVKTYLLDSLGVGIAGANTPLTPKVRAAASGWGAGDTAHVWGAGSFVAPAPIAAFINGFQIHGQEYDCVHEPAVVHPMAVILSALMAEIESHEAAVSGQDFTIAIAVAVDLAAGIGVAVKSPIKFFRPANAGLFGATLAIARLRGFDPDQTKDALGYALAFCSGTMQAHVEGKPALPLQVANASRSAIMACDVAEAGIPGPQDSLDGPYGYFSLFEDEADFGPVADTLGETWRIAEVSHKPFPTGRACQGGIVLMQKLRADGVDPSAITALTLTAPPLIHRLVGRPITEGLTQNYARLCFQYCGAVALLTGTVGLQDFTKEALARADVHALGKKITVIDDGTPDPAAFTPQIAEATLSDGRTVTARIDTLYGSPADPMSHEDHIAKFRACVAFGFGSARDDIADTLITLTESLETLSDARRLSRLAAGLETPPT